jgi:hypothetical protein
MNSTSPVAVLIADPDAFQSRYVAAGLVDAGVMVLGPVRSGPEACRFLEQEPHPHAVVLAESMIDDGEDASLLVLLRTHGIAHLVIISTPWQGTGRDLADTPVMQKPFASLQIVDWLRSVEIAAQVDRNGSPEPVCC